MGEHSWNNQLNGLYIQIIPTNVNEFWSTSRQREGQGIIIIIIENVSTNGYKNRILGDCEDSILKS